MVYLGRFQQVANQIAALQHPHILPLIDYGSYNATPYLVQPRVPATTLRSLPKGSTPHDALTIGGYLEQVAAALEYAHARAIVHGSLSTSCILKQTDGTLMVADMGVSRLLTLDEGDKHSAYIGSSESCAPEQLLGLPVSTATDIYALGAVLYRLLTDQPPFDGKTRDEIMQQHVSAPVPSLRQARKDVPVELDEVLAKAMAKEPQRRFPDVRSLVEAYYRAISPEAAARYAAVSMTPVHTTAKVPAIPRPVAPTTTQNQVSRRRMLTLSAGAGGVVVVGLVVLGSRLFSSAAPVAGTNAPAVQSSSAGAAQAPATGGSVLAHTSDLPLNSAKTFAIANQSNPGVLIHLPSSNFVAFDSTCTHAGCAVTYNQQSKLLECPCHGAAFDPASQAKVIQGPAQTPLKPIKIVVNADGTITL
jgi:serine/threonine protein kinase